MSCDHRSQIEERELNYYTTNAMTVGTQAALLAGFAFTGVIEAPWDYLEEMLVPEPVVSLCACSTLFGMLFQVLAIVKSVQISILGPGLALRGSEGSMTRALSVMRHEQRRLHWQFYIGLGFFHVATACFCGALFKPTTSIIAISAICVSFTWMILDCKSVAAELWLPPAASLWRSEVDRRKSVRYSCTAAAVGPSSAASAIVLERQRRQQPQPQQGGRGRAQPARPALRRRRTGPMARAARYIPDPLTGSFRMRDSVNDISAIPCESSPSPQQAQSAINLRNHPDEFAVRYALPHYTRHPCTHPPWR
jgi:hypothetical protein